MPGPSSVRGLTGSPGCVAACGEAVRKEFTESPFEAQPATSNEPAATIKTITQPCIALRIVPPFIKFLGAPQLWHSISAIGESVEETESGNIKSHFCLNL
jgi:hypothetical protein